MNALLSLVAMGNWKTPSVVLIDRGGDSTCSG